ncbi:MAG: Ldh family oxidoreductase [Chloroflexota bacterium]|nr:Ldh family oxidoreductase [Chloroflexota bacterium]
MSGSATEERARIAVDALGDFYVRAFSRAGLPPEDAATVARILMGADVHGIESHGAPLAHSYIRRLRNGAINPHPKIRVVSEFPGTLVLDGDRGIGPVVATYAMRQAIAKARENGVSTVTVRNSNHFSATCNYPLMAAAEGLAGMAMTTTSASVIPTFGAAPLLGTNPISIAFPGGNAEKPFLIDMSTSVVASGKVGVYRREGKPLPEGWSYDAEMRPTTDPQASRYLNPLGGDRDHGSQKGYGLNVTVDLFCGLLSGGRYSKQVPRSDTEPLGSAHMFSAWRIDAFVPMEEYAARFDEYIQMLHACTPASGHTRVLAPGDPEWIAEDDRRVNGIPLNPLVLADLQALAAELDIPFEG